MSTTKHYTWQDLPSVSLDALTFNVEDLNLDAIKAVYAEFGCFVVRGLFAEDAEHIRQDVESLVDEGYAQLGEADRNSAGWSTPNGCLFIPAPEHFELDRQIMTVPLDYRSSGTFLRTAVDPTMLELVQELVSPNVELMGHGQSLTKEPCGGTPKYLHQDGSYFTHKFEGPLACLSYAQDTTGNMGALRVMPGSHHFGLLPHIDTASHLGLDDTDWPMDKALEIPGAAGDGIFFHVNCIHGSKSNEGDRRRSVFIHRYRDVDDFTFATGHIAAEAAAAREANKDLAKPRNQNGLMIAGRRNVRP